jgi:hypothetical protein
MSVGTWYQVRFDEQGVHRSAQPPGGEPWKDFIAWDDIVRVCLEVEAFVETEGLYLFARHRPESYAIPMQADGGPELLQAIIERGLFPAELAIEAASAAEGLFCWPAEG